MTTAMERVQAREQLGRYEVIGRLACGGMAELLLARQIGPDGFEKVVALKRIHAHLAQEEHFIKMFRDEARIAARLSHPNIAQIYDLGKLDGTYFIAMEYVWGRNLVAVAKKAGALGAPVPPRLAARCIAQVCEALHYAHTLRDGEGRPMHIVHRDVSPQNILIAFSGTAKLVDFGVAKAATNLAETRAGDVKGKFTYMSPEQAEGRVVDPRSDLFSAGVVLFELLTGTRPFERATSILTLSAIVDEAHPDPRAFDPELPTGLAAIIDRALAKRPRDRWPSAQAMQLALEDFVGTSPRSCNNVAVSLWMTRLFKDELYQEGGEAGRASMVLARLDDRMSVLAPEAQALELPDEVTLRSHVRMGGAAAHPPSRAGADAEPEDEATLRGLRTEVCLAPEPGDDEARGDGGERAPVHLSSSAHGGPTQISDDPWNDKTVGDVPGAAPERAHSASGSGAPDSSRVVAAEGSARVPSEAPSGPTPVEPHRGVSSGAVRLISRHQRPLSLGSVDASGLAVANEATVRTPPGYGPPPRLGSGYLHELPPIDRAEAEQGEAAAGAVERAAEQSGDDAVPHAAAEVAVLLQPPTEPPVAPGQMASAAGDDPPEPTRPEPGRADHIEPGPCPVNGETSSPAGPTRAVRALRGPSDLALLDADVRRSNTLFTLGSIEPGHPAGLPSGEPAASAVPLTEPAPTLKARPATASRPAVQPTEIAPPSSTTAPPLVEPAPPLAHAASLAAPDLSEARTPGAGGGGARPVRRTNPGVEGPSPTSSPAASVPMWAPAVPLPPKVHPVRLWLTLAACLVVGLVAGAAGSRGLRPPHERQLTVHSQPAEAQIYIDDTLQPVRTPATIAGLKVGVTYVVKLVRDGYDPLIERVTFEPGGPEALLVDVTLHPRP